MAGRRRTKEQPDGRDDDLDAHQGATEDELRARADVARSLRRPAAGAEDASDAIRLDEES